MDLSTQSLQERNFVPHIRISFQSTDFLVRTIETESELMQVMELRSRCFPLRSLEPDRFDRAADHLIVIDQNTKQICGAYRISCSDYAMDFESRHDFKLENFLSLPGRKLELAWACVDPGYRGHLVITLLWRGLIEVFKTLQPRYVFGLTSVGLQEVTNLPNFCQYLEGQFQIDHALQIQPQTSKAVSDLSASAAAAKTSWTMRKIPNLLRIYLLAGALICAQPAFDPEINVYDFFTVLDLDQPASNFLEKLTGL
jgi:putative hemolysin